MIEDRAVDLVNAGRDWGGKVDERRMVRRSGDTDRRAAALQAWGHDDGYLRRRRVDDARTGTADLHAGKRRPVDRKSCAFDRDAPAFNRAQRMNGGDTDRHST